jgi:hypothetical protein
LHYLSTWQLGYVISCIDTIRLLVNHGRNDPTEEDDDGMSFLSEYTGMSEPYIWVLKQEEFQIDILQTGTLPFHSVARSFARTWEETSPQSHSWQIAVQMLLHLGVPLSPLMPGTVVTLLDVLFEYDGWAVNSGPLADAWLSLLVSAGADIEEYVSREKYLHPSGFVHSTYPNNRQEEWPRKRLIFEKGDSKCQRIRWEWVWSVESPAHLILNEFSALGYPLPFILPGWEYNWPFIFSEAHKNLGYPPPTSTKEQEFYDSKMATLEARWARQAFRRFQRSQYSPRQIKPSRSEKRCRVPGAWVEDPFQTPYTFRYRRRSSLQWWLYVLALAVAFLASRSFLCPEGQIPMIDRMNCENSDW